MKILAFTGHRPAQLGGYDEQNPTNLMIKEYLKKLIEFSISSGYDCFITGMAMGVDQWAGNIVAEFKTKYPHIKLIAAVPFAQQPHAWFGQTQKQWLELLKQCDEIYVIDTQPDTPMALEEVLEMGKVKNTVPKYQITHKLFARNHWMVDKADCMMAIWNGSGGGTGECVKYAQTQNKKIIAFNPVTQNVSKI